MEYIGYIMHCTKDEFLILPTHPSLYCNMYTFDPADNGESLSCLCFIGGDPSEIVSLLSLLDSLRTLALKTFNQRPTLSLFYAQLIRTGVPTICLSLGGRGEIDEFGPNHPLYSDLTELFTEIWSPLETPRLEIL